MDTALCSEHGKPCMVKTGTRPGPSLGKSFFICANMENRCSYVKEARKLEAQQCPQHEQMVELQLRHFHRTSQQHRTFYRCSQGKQEKKNWCGHWTEEDGKAEKSPRPLQPKDPNTVASQNKSPSKAATKCTDAQSRMPAESKSSSVKLPEETKAAQKETGNTDKAVRPKVFDAKGDSNGAKSTNKPKTQASSGALPSFAGLSQQNETIEALENLSFSSKVSSTPKPSSHLLSRVKDAEEWRDSSGYVNSDDDSDDDCVIVEKPARQQHRVISSSPETSESSSVSDEKSAKAPSSSDDFLDLGSSSEEEKAEAKPKAPDGKYGKLTSSSEDSPIKSSPKAKEKAESQPKAEYRKLPSGQLVRIVKKTPSPQKQDTSENQKEGLASNQKTEIKDKEQTIKPKPETARFKLPASSTGTLQGDIRKLHEVNSRYDKHKDILKKVDIHSLPDGGAKLLRLIKDLKQQTVELREAIDANSYPAPKVTAPAAQGQGQVRVTASGQQVASGVRQTKITEHTLPQNVYQQMYATQPQLNSLYGGRMTKARLAEVGSVTSEAIDRLHKQLESMPGKEEEVEDPQHLNLTLMSHQRQALRWLSWREHQHPPGGILADDMGLGKTLTMISLILHQKQLQGAKDSPDKTTPKSKPKKDAEDDGEWLSKDKDAGGCGDGFKKSSATLVVCPASLVHQWDREIERRVSAGVLKVLLYHGPQRERSVKALASADVVLTTYNLISKEVGVPDDIKKDKSAHDMPSTDQASVSRSDSPLLRVGWHRIILDEAHAIKNHRSLGALAVCRLRAGRRWALTGTPLHNDLLDVYSLLRFLRAAPFDEYKVWKRQVDNKSERGQKRLNMLIKTLLLRRTKDQSNSTTGLPLVDLPGKTASTHSISLGGRERAVYDRIFQQSKKNMMAYLQKHEDKQFEKEGGVGGSISTNPWAKDDQLQPSYSYGGASQQQQQQPPPPSIFHQKPSSAMQGKRDNSASQILLMLLRLRQCCSHLSLMREAVDTDALQADGLDLDLAQQLADMSLKPDADLEEPEVKDKVKDMFEIDADSSKVEAVMKHLLDIRDQNLSSASSAASAAAPMKSVVVSQWTRMLDVIEHHLGEEGIVCATIKGSVPAKERAQLVDAFNTDPHGPQVMLISLRAGGVGLNLIGGNHLFLIDMHWNPALEQQACDRIYRMGQQREVFIHRFICKDTVEEKILELQKKKLSLASNVLSGTRAAANKLSLEDLRMLFGLDMQAAAAQPQRFQPMY